MASQPVSNDEHPGDEHAADRRRDDRFVTIFRAGKLTHGGEEQLCMLRNISANGAMLNHNIVMARGDEVVLDLRCDERMAARVAWVDGDKCGVAFHGLADLERLLARHGSEKLRPRPPRLRLEAAAKVKAGDRLIDVVLRDISQNGACFRGDPLLMPKEPELRLILPELGDYRAIVRWRRQKFVGVSFASTLPMWPLNDWVRRNRKAPAAL